MKLKPFMIKNKDIFLLEFIYNEKLLEEINHKNQLTGCLVKIEVKTNYKGNSFVHILGNKTNLFTLIKFLSAKSLENFICLAEANAYLKDYFKLWWDEQK